MLSEHASVVAVEGDGLWVETLKQSACGVCSAKSGCGQHLLANYMRDMSCIKARFPKGESQRIWKVGDAVEIGVNENAVVVGALLVYVFPLCVLMLFSAVAYVLRANDALIAVSGMFGLLLSAVLIKRLYTPNKGSHFKSLDVIVLD